MGRKINPYLAFDDRKFILIGSPIIAFLIPMVFFGIDISTYMEIGTYKFPESFCYTATFWLLNRSLVIKLRKKYNAFKQTLKRIIIQTTIVLLLVPPIGALITFLLSVLYNIFDLPNLYDPTFIQGLTATYFITILLLVIYDAIFFFHKYREAITEKNKLQIAHVQGQLDNLRNQINPHFLFNSLNTLMSLIPSDTKGAMNYLDKLSKFYRYTVSHQDEPLISLHSEIENLKIYSQLLQERFRNAIEIKIDVNPPHSSKVIPLCLQLLVENAVKHNIVSNKRPLQVRIELIDADTYISTSNNKQKKISEVKSTGKGLKNIKSRMAFFTDQEVKIDETLDTFTVALPIIYETEDHESNYN